ncbi:DJ-1/PfpI family protein [Photobacterium sanctipauli]|uniref:DJ-1/PfpI family protein n=1 Tax=Photobacterium sanctipauli TaxID=1342794 RepID=A0A2T3NZN7_9GAMM|nr:DJ-1/PfpI family protein [Photobacterium sanctipauli]PSW21702.1 DJ-1/PfpI family protein [Photobacterium sanctipauli]
MNIAIYIYDDAEVLDLSGPFEVFSTAKRLTSHDWNVFLVAENLQPVKARGGFMVNAHYTIEDHPAIDLLVVVGGVQSGEVKKENVIRWIKQVDQSAAKVASVCTGAFLLAKAGLLDELTVTTHREDIQELAETYPSLNVVAQQRWVDSGKYITSGGISAGIDMSLYLVSQLISRELAENTARQMEYRWQEC